MNRALYRIVFNASRAQLMAVAETVVAPRRSIPGGTRRRRVAVPRALLLGATLAVAGAIPGDAYAQIVAYRSAPATQQATILSAGNGVALINIQTPSAAGVSRNAYSQFDVAPAGAILNNARTATSSQLAGWVAGNPWLARGSARVILNEVIAAQPSVLRGYVEVAGSAAQVVIANPSGISCAGCGFINAQRSTLTTGTPLFSGNGDLDGYRVERGTVSIDGGGLDASRVAYTDLIARAVSINAGIWANTLAVTTGANVVAADNTQVRPEAAPTVSPAWAIDVAALGGMYAGKIVLIGSEAGVGVRNAGVIAASAGDVVVTADGRLQNAGQIISAGQTRITSGGLDNSGTVYAQREVIVSARGRIDNSGAIAAQRDTTIHASGDRGIASSATGLLAAGVSALGEFTETAEITELAEGGRLTLTADAQIAVHGQAIAPLEQTLRAASLDLSGARLSARTLTLHAASGDLDARQATLSAGDRLTVFAAQSLIHDQASSQARQLRLTARSISNVHGQLLHTGDDELSIALSGKFDNRQGRLISNAHDLRLAAREIDDTDAAIVHAGSGALILTADTLTTTRGQLSTAGTVRIDASELANRAGRITQSGNGETVVNVRQYFDNRDGMLNSNGSARLLVGALDNRGGSVNVSHGGTLELTANGAIDNAAGGLVADAGVTLRASGIDNRGGIIASLGAPLLADSGEQHFTNDAGRIEATGSLILHGSTVSNAGGVIVGQDDVRIAARSLRNTRGQVSALGTLQIATERDIDNENGLLVAGARVELQANGIDNRQGTIAAEHDRLTAEAGSGVFDNGSGLLAADGPLVLNAAGIVNDGGTIASLHEQLAVAARNGGLDNNAGRIEAARSIVVSGDGVANAAGTIVGQTLAIDSHRRPIENARGTLAASGALDLRSGALDNDDGLIQSGDTVAIDTDGQTLRNTGSGTGGGIIAQGVLGLSSGELINTGSRIGGQDDVLLRASSVDNTQGSITALASLRLDAGRKLDNSEGVLAAGGRAELTARSLINVRGTIASEHDALAADASADLLDNSGGRIEAAGSLVLSGTTITNAVGTIVGQDLSLDSRQQAFDNTRGTLAASSTLDLHSGALINDAGLIQAGTAIAIDTHGQPLNNADSAVHGGIVSSGTLKVDTGDLINDGGLMSSEHDFALLARSVHNAQGQISALGALAIDARRGIDNRQGLLAADGRLGVRATGIDNRRGTIAARHDQLVVDAGDEALDNTSGRIEAMQAIALRANGITNTDGILLGEDVLIDSRRHDLRNAHGTLAARAALSVESGMLDNDSGLIQAGGALRIDTHERLLINGDTDASGGIVTSGSLSVSAGDLDNTSGFIGAKQRLSISARNLANTAGGKVSGEDGIEMTASVLDNQGGQIQSLASATLHVSDTIDNRAGVLRSASQLAIDTARLVNTGAVDAQALTILTDLLDNRTGALRAGQTLNITSAGLIDNGDGLISSAGRLVVADPRAAAGASPSDRTLAMRNTHGTLIADRQLAFDGAVLGGDGTLFSLGDLSVNVLADFNNSGELAANGDATLSTAGTLSNRAVLRSAKTLTIDSASLDNSANAQIVAPSLHLVARDAHTLTNRGLIDGGEVLIDSVTVNNLGGARLYGDHLAIAATRLDNAPEAGSAPVIAARDRLDIGAESLSNAEHALIFSAGDLAIGGTLDASRRATGQAATLDNTSATIEALGTLTISAGRLGNYNAHIETAVVALPAQQIVEYQGSGSATRFAPGTPGVYVFNDESDQLMTPEGKYESWLRYDYTRDTRETQLVRSDPGKIIAARDMQLFAEALTNDNSQIIAGATLSGRIGSLSNRETSGERSVSDAGTVTSYWRNHRKGRDSTGSSVAEYAPPPTILSISLGTSVFRQGSPVAASGVRPAMADIGLVTQSAAGIDPATAQVSAGPLPVANTAFAGGTLEPVASTTHVGAEAVMPIAHTAQAVASGAQNAATALGGPIARIIEVPLAATAGNMLPVRYARSISPVTTLPDNSLFRVLVPTPTTRTLVETDPQFTNQRQWLSSDYLLARTGDASALTQKRLGDGFYEQRLLREQIAQLTGQRFLAGFSDDEAQYRALMDAAATQARRLQIEPGIALSAEQMAQLTADIVWLVERNVMLADGSIQKVLVPQVYALVRDGDLAADGALIAANDIDLALDNALHNGGTIAGRKIVTLSAENIGNIGGRIDAQDLALAARRDLANIGGSLRAENRLIARAGNDLSISSTTRSQSNAQGSRSTIDRVAGLYVSGAQGTLFATAGNDLALIGARIENTAATAHGTAGGATALLAGHDVRLATLSEDVRQNIVWDGENTRSDARRTDVGSTLRGSGDIVVQAGNDFNARAAYVGSEYGAVRIAAGNDINLVAGEAAVQVDEAHRHSEKGFLSRTTRSTRDTIDERYALANTLSAATTTLSAGNDLRVTGSNVVASADTAFFAGRDITLEAARTSSQQTHFNEVTRSGVFSSGGVGFTIGSQQLSTQQTDALTRAQASTVGSIAGNVLISAGNAYRQVGSDVIAAQGSIDVAAKTIDVVDARETWRSVVESKAKQSGLTIALSNPVITAVQSVQQMRDAAHATSDARMQVLAAASSALAVKSAADAIIKGQRGNPLDSANGGTTDASAPSVGERVGGIDIGFSIGSASQQSTMTQTRETASGSRLIAGTDLRLRAAGAGEASTLTLRAASLAAGRDMTLAADGQIALLAAPNTAEQHSSSQGRNASIGFSVGTSGLLLNAGAGKLRGNADGTDTSWSETEVVAGRRLAITSGGDTVLRGAQARAEQIVADVGNDLSIESLQDTSSYASQRSSGGFTLSLGAGRISGSISAARSTIDSDYASVVEQSGLQAADGGFQVKVRGDTSLAGGVIASNQTAIDQHSNVVSTGGTLSLTDLANHAEYDAQAAGVSIGSAISFSGALPRGGIGTGAGIGQDSSNASSTTRSGISGIAGNTGVRSGDSSGGIANTFDAEKVQGEIDAQVQITQMFGHYASQSLSDYVQAQRTGLQEKLKTASDTEKATLHDQLNDLDVKERVANVLIGSLSGTGTAALTKESLSMAAQKMRETMIENSRTFLGVTDGTTTLSNHSGVSEGIRGDQFKVAGTRFDLDLLCGADNRRCKTFVDDNGQTQLALNGEQQVQFDPEKAGGKTLAEFLETTEEGRKLAGITGGIQGMKGSLFGIAYKPGSWQDKLVEAFAGTHDLIGGQWSGLYDKTGNANRGRGDVEKGLQETWSATGAILASTPFAASELLSAEAWNAIATFLKEIR